MEESQKTTHKFMSDPLTESGKLLEELSNGIFVAILKGGSLTVVRSDELFSTDYTKPTSFNVGDSVVVRKKMNDTPSQEDGEGLVFEYKGVLWKPGPTYFYLRNGTVMYYV